MLLALYEVSEEWSKKRGKGEKVGALRIAILQLLVMEIPARLITAGSENPGSRGWLDELGQLQFLTWNPDSRKLAPNREQEARSRLNIPAQVPVLLLDDDNDADLMEPPDIAEEPPGGDSLD